MRKFFPLLILYTLFSLMSRDFLKNIKIDTLISAGLLNTPNRLQYKEPSRQSQRTKQRSQHDSTSGNGSFVPHISCHDKTASSSGTAQHDKNGNQFFPSESQPDGDWQKEQAEQHQFDACNAENQGQLVLGVLKLKACPQGNQGQRCCHVAQISDGFVQYYRMGKMENRP